MSPVSLTVWSWAWKTVLIVDSGGEGGEDSCVDAEEENSPVTKERSPLNIVYSL